jgi:hypothetical protein
MLTLSPKRRFYSDADGRLIKFYVHFLLFQVSTDVTIGAVKGQQRQDEHREGCLEFDVTVFRHLVGAIDERQQKQQSKDYG